MTDVIVAGAGGFGAEVYQWLADAAAAGAPFRVQAVVDDHATAVAWGPAGLEVIGTTAAFAAAPGARAVIAIGEPRARRAVAQRLRDRGVPLLTVVHPLAYVAPTAVLGDGALVCPFAFVAPYARVGANAVVNVYASVGHHAAVGDHANLCPYATLNAHAVVDEGGFLGTHATVAAGRRIGAWSKVAAGAVVYRDVGPKSLAQGDPARSRELFDAP